jgi:hypothetical protein
MNDDKQAPNTTKETLTGFRELIAKGEDEVVASILEANAKAMVAEWLISTMTPAGRARFFEAMRGRYGVGVVGGPNGVEAQMWAEPEIAPKPNGVGKVTPIGRGRKKRK